MKKTPFNAGISTRIIVFFIVFGILMSSIFVGTVILLEHLQSEESFDRILKTEYGRFIEEYRHNASVPLPQTEYMKFYVGIDSVPEDKRKSVADLKPGYYETGIHGGVKGPGHFHVAIQPLPGTEEKVFMFFFPYFRGFDTLTLQHHSVVGFFILLLFIFPTSIFVAKRVTCPLRRLITLVNNANPDNLPGGFSDSYHDDEVGALARALEKSMERTKAFLTREHQFTRDASHELRTPITAMKGAVELLQQLPACEEEKVDRLAKRMDRSVSEMESIIEALLWLSREGLSEVSSQMCEVAPIVEDIMRQYQEQYREKGNRTDMEAAGDLKIKAPPAVVRITISNLIRNAFQFTRDGEIRVHLSDTGVEITDTGTGIAPDDLDRVRQPAFRGKESQGFGFGLDIVSRLCDRFDWRLEIESTPGKGTTARLIFRT